MVRAFWSRLCTVGRLHWFGSGEAGPNTWVGRPHASDNLEHFFGLVLLVLYACPYWCGMSAYMMVFSVCMSLPGDRCNQQRIDKLNSLQNNRLERLLYQDTFFLHSKQKGEPKTKPPIQTAPGHFYKTTRRPSIRIFLSLSTWSSPVFANVCVW